MHLIPEIEFSGTIWQWKGPAPFYFVTIPKEECKELRAISKLVTYGWGMIPVIAKIGETEWKTSLFPQKEEYVLPIKKTVRTAENLSDGDEVHVTLNLA